jgi:hypothetical protein
MVWSFNDKSSPSDPGFPKSEDPMLMWGCFRPRDRKAIHRERVRVDTWNAAFPVGTPVIVVLEDGSTIRTRTTSEAMIWNGHTAIIWVEDLRELCRLVNVTADESTPLKSSGAERR